MGTLNHVVTGDGNVPSFIVRRPDGMRELIRIQTSLKPRWVSGGSYIEVWALWVQGIRKPHYDDLALMLKGQEGKMWDGR